MAKGPNTVRVWIWDVINPLIRNVEAARQILDSGVYTWRFVRDRLEFVELAGDFFEDDELPNLEDFCESNPGSADAVRAWDDGVRKLRGYLAQESQYLTQQHPTFTGIVMAAGDALVNSGKTNPLRPWPRDKWPNVIAQHVVNNKGDGPPADGTSEFWKSIRERVYSEIAGDQHWQRWHSENKQHAQDASKAGERLVATLKEARRLLAEEFDVPHAPPKHSARA